MLVTETPNCFQSGIWWHRIHLPGRALAMRGHGIQQVAIGKEFSEEQYNWTDTVIFGRIYPPMYDPIKIMREFKKRGKRVLYDMDDDFWEVAKDNPSAKVSNAMKDQYEAMIKEADAVITPSKVLAKKFKKYFKKPVFICPNTIDKEYYQERAHEQPELVVGYMGAASHWKDLQIIADVVEQLSQEHDFWFVIYGLTGDPIEAALYTYDKLLATNLTPEKNAYYRAALDFYSKFKSTKIQHIPFHPPEMHPGILSRADFDIGLAPLEDTKFNAGKSNIKFYEYAAVGTVTLASDVEPYKSEVNYLAKNTYKDWYKKLKKLIVDKEFRAKKLKQQQDWVFDNRSTEAIGLDWELACQLPSDGPTVLRQRK